MTRLYKYALRGRAHPLLRFLAQLDHLCMVRVARYPITISHIDLPYRYGSYLVTLFMVYYCARTQSQREIFPGLDTGFHFSST